MPDQTTDHAAEAVDVGPVTVGEPAPRTLSPLEQALRAAVKFAKAHGFDDDITHDDFGIQRSGPGITHATHVSPTHVIAVTIGGIDGLCIGVGEIDWVHYPIDSGCGICDPGGCDECGAESADDCTCDADGPIHMRTVYLPGDAPAEVDHCPPAVLDDSDPVARDLADVDAEEPEWML
ncbi:hypothetical protein [Nocardia asiatica]|uniref:hypothetical protein n=1 Tax=Nocardia asiatica TaxID=209252 RepID=UPI0024585B76|nr:hypothetical protein [Nocardia asiatica]